MQSEITEQEAKKIIYERMPPNLIQDIKNLIRHFVADKWFRFASLMAVVGFVLMCFISETNTANGVGIFDSTNLHLTVITLSGLLIFVLSIIPARKAKDGFDFNIEGQAFLTKWRETGELPPVTEKKVK